MSLQVWEDLQPLSPDMFWLFWVAVVIAFLLAFSVGANDVSNSFGTSVGARVLTVTQACLLATFFEVAGATLLGYAVCDTFRRNMYDVKQYEGSQRELMLGALATLIGSASWNMAATALKMPISGTHSIVGATLGFSLVSRGVKSVKWYSMLKIVASWFLSPLLAGCIASLIYLLISKTIICKVDPLKYGLKALPLFYGVTLFINVASVVIAGPQVFGLDKLSWYTGLFISLVVGGLVICGVAIFLVPKMYRIINDEIINARIAGGYSKPLPKAKPKSKPKPAPAALRSQSLDSSHLTPALLKTTSLTTAEQPQTVGYENAAFAGSPDEEAPAPAPVGAEAGAAPGSPQEAPPPPPPPPPGTGTGAGTTDTDEPTTTSPPPQLKPKVAPKPTRLARQRRLDEAGQEEQLEEIDLTVEPVGAFYEASARHLAAPGPGAAARASTVSAPPTPCKPPKAERFGSSTGYDVEVGPSGRPSMVRGERFEVFRLFSSLQILTACFASFAHGTNDVSNAVAPLVTIWNIYSLGAEDITISTQVWILFFGGIGICCGLWAWGRSVMKTVGEGLTQLTPSKGFAIELGTAISVLGASKLGLPISTTHCKVGAVVLVGLVGSKFCSRDNLLDEPLSIDKEAAANGKGDKQGVVDWNLFGNIAITWIVTVPLAAGVSALVMLALQRLFL